MTFLTSTQEYCGPMFWYHALRVISSQFNLKDEEENLRQLFKQFDTEKKGFISISAFTNVLCKFFGENEAILHSLKKIMCILY